MRKWPKDESTGIQKGRKSRGSGLLWDVRPLQATGGADETLGS